MPNPIGYDEAYIEKVHFYFPIICNVYFVFILNYYCNIISTKKIDSEIITPTILISIYLLICDSLISAIKLILGINNLYIFQLIFTIIAGLIPAIVLLRFIMLLFLLIFNQICNCELNCYFLCCILCCKKINNLFFDSDSKYEGIF